MLARITTHIAFSTVLNATMSLRSFAATAAELRGRDEAIRASRVRGGTRTPAPGAGAGAGGGAGASLEHDAPEDEDLLELAAEVDHEIFGSGDAGDAAAEGGAPALDEGGVLNLL